MSQATGPSHAFGLRGRIFVLLSSLVLLLLFVAMITTWYAVSTKSAVENIASRDLAMLRTAQTMETELGKQKGYATYFFLSDDQSWLSELQDHSGVFLENLDKAREGSFLPQGAAILDRISWKYDKYQEQRARVIDLYRAGQREKGAREHWEVRRLYDRLVALTGEFLHLHEDNVARTAMEANYRATMMMMICWPAVGLAAVLALVLGYIMFRQVLGPIRRLLDSGLSRGDRAGDEIQALDERMAGLMNDVDRAKEQVMHKEKLALAGKLAAGVAHSIRNPMTSVKMRVFSLGRSLDLDEDQQDDFDVISQEIAHIDTIVQNFLEFARPPKLKPAKASPSEVVENVLVLLRHRLQSYGVSVERVRGDDLPAVLVDSDQLKEALANIILNACEAMPHGGGTITVREETRSGVHGPEAVLLISDNGPGIPPSVISRVFEPFFSTKEDGSGLGLSIARRIVVEHGGSILVRNMPRGGAEFVLSIPCKEDPRHG